MHHVPYGSSTIFHGIKNRSLLGGWREVRKRGYFKEWELENWDSFFLMPQYCRPPNKEGGEKACSSAQKNCVCDCYPAHTHGWLTPPPPPPPLPSVSPGDGQTFLPRQSQGLANISGKKKEYLVRGRISSYKSRPGLVNLCSLPERSGFGSSAEGRGGNGGGGRGAC